MKRKIFEVLTVVTCIFTVLVGTGQTRTLEADISDPIVDTEVTKTLINVPSHTYSIGIGRDLYIFSQIASVDRIDVEENDVPVVAESEVSNEQEIYKENEPEEKSTEVQDQSKKGSDELDEEQKDAESVVREEDSSELGTIAIPETAFKVSSTAYYNPDGNRTADGSRTIAGLTLAGKKNGLVVNVDSTEITGLSWERMSFTTPVGGLTGISYAEKQ